MPILLQRDEKISHAFPEWHGLNFPGFTQHYEMVAEKLHCHCRHLSDLHLNCAVLKGARFVRFPFLPYLKTLSQQLRL